MLLIIPDDYRLIYGSGSKVPAPCGSSLLTCIPKVETAAIAMEGFWA